MTALREWLNRQFIPSGKSLTLACLTCMVDFADWYSETKDPVSYS